jgi:serine/threonine-protein kinase
MALESGTRLGPYEVVACLGAGGMGEVYRARDTRLGRDVAVKVLPPEAAAKEADVLRFKQEAHAVSSLNHPNILTVLDFGQTDSFTYIVTEYIEGETLRRRMLAGGLAVEEVLEVAAQIAGALAAAHRAGIVHRDIKPENVMLRPDGYVKVLDFGIAKLTGAHAEYDTEAPTMARIETSPGMVLGTFRYMSPEQARGLLLDARSDIFSLGVVLYEMLTGRALFDGETGADILVAILKKDPPPLDEIVPDLPPEVEMTVMRCLEKEREQRYQTARELADDLKRLARGNSSLSPARPAADPRPSIAVLPFANMSTDPESEFFCDGLAEELLNALAKLEDLRVAARTSAFSFKGKGVDVREIGRKLGVATVLEGSLRKAGNRVRIMAQLIDVADGCHLWSERFDRTMDDVFEVQDEISQSIVDALTVRLVRAGALAPGAWQPRRASTRPVNVEAHEAFLKGRFYWNQRTWESIRRGIECFTESVGKDPLYAPAYVGLADSLNLLGYYNERPPAQAFPQAKAAALKALEIDGSIAGAHASLGYTHLFYEWDWPAAGREFRRAIELDPTYASAYQWYGWYFFAAGQLDEAVATIRRAHEIDPLSPIINAHFALSLSHAGRHDEALRTLGETLDLNPNFMVGHLLLGWANVNKGVLDAATEHLDRAVELSGGKFGMGHLGHAYAVSGREAEARTMLGRLEEVSRQRYISPLEFAFVHAGLGETNRAVEYLESACRDRTGDLIRLKLQPWPDALRSDPRFADIARRIGLA